MKRIAILLALSLLPIPAACGSGGPSTSIHVTVTDFEFSPAVFTVPAGAPISLTAVNNGAVKHSFVIMKHGYEVKDHFTDADNANAYWEKPDIQPGQTVTDTFTAPPDPGEYQIVCHVAGHFEAGMVARLIVVQAGP